MRARTRTHAHPPQHAKQVTATAFLRQFAEDTSGSSKRALLIVCLWLAITLGRVVGLRDQMTLTLVRLYRHAAALCAAGAAAMFVLLVFNRSTVMLWITVVAFGIFTGPLLGYGYDLSTRVSPNPATSTAVAQFGITAGARYFTMLLLRSSHQGSLSCCRITNHEQQQYQQQ